jgi:hypothetical protein
MSAGWRVVIGRLKVEERPRHAGGALVDARLPIDLGEVRGGCRELGAPEHQKSGVRERRGEQRLQPGPRPGIELIEEKGATDQVDPGERRVFLRVVRREHAQVAHGVQHLVIAAGLGEEGPQQIAREPSFDLGAVDAGARALENRAVDVGAKDLQGELRQLSARQVLGQDDGDGVDFFSRGAPRDPDAQRRGQLPPRHELGKHLGLQRVETSAWSEQPCLQGQLLPGAGRAAGGASGHSLIAVRSRASA